MLSDYYILTEDKEIEPVDFDGYLEWLKTGEYKKLRRVALHKMDEIVVSTVFLGLDHNLSFDSRDDKPLVFETMIFEDPEHPGRESHCERYSTYADALDGHYRACELAWGTHWREKMVYGGVS